MKIEINRADGLLIERALKELRDRLLESAELQDEKSVLYEDLILQAKRCHALEFIVNDYLNMEQKK